MIKQSFLQQKRTTNESGFTLIELLVVMLIIGILVAIIVPSLLSQRRAAEDASLQSDLTSAATTYQTWRQVQDNDNAKFFSLAGSSQFLYVAHPDADYLKNTPASFWVNQIDSPDMVVSPRNFLTLNVIASATPAMITKGWDRKFDEGEVCIVGTNPNSNYNYKAGSGSPSNYVSLLYYDTKLGGVKDMSDLVAAKNSGKTVSCAHYVNRYLKAVPGGTGVK